MDSAPGVKVARHLVEAVFQLQAGARCIEAARAALGPVRGAERVWAELDAMALSLGNRAARAQLAVKEAVGRGELASEHVCPLCLEPESTGERRSR